MKGGGFYFSNNVKNIYLCSPKLCTRFEVSTVSLSKVGVAPEGVWQLGGGGSKDVSRPH